MPKEQQQFGIDFCETLRKVKPVNVDIIVKDGDSLDWAGGCQVISTPGHISLFLTETNSIVTGDAAVVENGELVIANPQFALDLNMAQDSLKKIISMNADNYYCFTEEDQLGSQKQVNTNNLKSIDGTMSKNAITVVTGVTESRKLSYMGIDFRQKYADGIFIDLKKIYTSVR